LRRGSLSKPSSGLSVYFAIRSFTRLTETRRAFAARGLGLSIGGTDVRIQNRARARNCVGGDRRFRRELSHVVRAPRLSPRDLTFCSVATVNSADMNMTEMFRRGSHGSARCRTGYRAAVCTIVHDVENIQRDLKKS
jgi:hypothetical protein